MTAVIYIHGFLSSPQSHKAQVVARWLAEEHPQVSFYCPQLTPYPGQTQQQLDDLVADLKGQHIGLMGSSMGGFWATYLAEACDLPAVLINPACEPLKLMPQYIDQTLQNYHTEQTYQLNSSHLDELTQVPAHSAKRLANYWVLLQTGDETLDYNKAVSKYQGAEMLVEEGGDHSFQNFERHLSASLAFFDKFYAREC
ncbi:YqiA/YcfP family alpha/beta fold hydrolase [Halioxenophilus aromaticivorans]|uniref:Esterase YqiA n=1 Tax=Halioxenophilus aromaticivorans TaxID=1306992 RepID=A0AAV3U242_9ALTE